MSGHNNLKNRLQYFGGDPEGRMRQDKLRSLRGALWNSYQAETAILSDQREFKCLINPNKNTTDYDNKILSIPFYDFCLNPDMSYKEKTSEGFEEIGLDVGDVFTWKETDTHWLVYLKYLEEDAYFRAQIRRCDQQIEINGNRYWVYIRGPVETSIVWNQKAGVEWNDLNYSLVMFITKNKETVDFFHRFTKIKILEPETNKSKTWQVVGQNPYYGDGIIQVFLDEYFENTIADMAEKEKSLNATNEIIDTTSYYINGPLVVNKYDTVTYIATNFTEDGTWYLKDGDLEESALENTSKELELDVLTNSGTFILSYRTENEEATLKVTIDNF